MHPRNPYRKKRNFAELASEFPDFAPHVKMFENGNATIDFKDATALRSLTQTLLRKDFDLNVILPPDRLIPAVPQRLNYVLWIEDLVALMDLPVVTLIRGMDVGTGASAIFPLLICRNNPLWSVVAVDKDPESVNYARQNVERNDLGHRISVRLVDESNDWSKLISESADLFHFLMCNPPFFDRNVSNSIDNEFESNDNNNNDETPERKQEKSESNCSSVAEAVVPGGEVAFVQDMIHKSFAIKQKVQIFSSMLGRKSSLIALKKELKKFQSENEDLTFTTTEFCQGKTMRWGVAWSFTLNLSQSLGCKVRKTTKPLVLSPIPYKKGMFYSIEGLTDYIVDLIVTDLSIKTFHVTRMSKISSEILLKSLTNTWSNQRRKRREKKRFASGDTDLHEHLNAESSLEPVSPVTSVKRKRDEHDLTPESPIESLEYDSPIPDGKRLRDRITLPVGDPSPDDGVNYLLNCCITLRKEGTGITLKLETRQPCQSSEATHQLFQYLKNKLTVDFEREKRREDMSS